MVFSNLNSSGRRSGLGPRGGALALGLLGTLLLAGCGGTGIVRYDAEQCPIPTGRGADYFISTGDLLEVFVWRNAELTVTVPVRPDGRISTPLVEDMAAAGKTPSQLARDLEDVLGEYIRSPEVNVIVTSQGPANQVQVIGQVANPQALPYRDGLRLLDVLVSAGGLTQFAAGNRATLSREVNNQQIECEIRAASLAGGDLSQNVRVFPGDVFIVPETRL